MDLVRERYAAKALLKARIFLLVFAAVLTILQPGLDALGAEHRIAVPPPVYSQYPILNAPLSDKQAFNLGLTKRQLTAPWTGYNYSPKQKKFLPDTLKSGTAVWINGKGDPIYKADCGNLLLPPEYLTLQCPDCNPPPQMHCPDFPKWLFWVPWLVLLFLLLPLVWALWKYSEAQEQNKSLRRDIGTLGRDKINLATAKEALEHEIAELQPRIGVPDPGPFTLPSDECYRMEPGT